MACVVSNCGNTIAQKHQGVGHSKDVSFFQFPSGLTASSLKAKNAWLKAITNGAVNWEPRSRDFVCSDHFENSCILYRNDGVRYLRKNVVPTIFPSGTTPHTSTVIKVENVSDSETEENKYLDDLIEYDENYDEDYDSNSQVHLDIVKEEYNIELPPDESETNIDTTDENEFESFDCEAKEKHFFVIKLEKEDVDQILRSGEVTIPTYLTVNSKYHLLNVTELTQKLRTDQSVPVHYLRKDANDYTRYVEVRTLKQCERLPEKQTTSTRLITNRIPQSPAKTSNKLLKRAIPKTKKEIHRNIRNIRRIIKEFNSKINGEEKDPLADETSCGQDVS